MNISAQDVVNSGAKIVGVVAVLPVAVGLTATVAAVLGPVYAGYRLAKLCHRAHKNAKESSYNMNRRRRQPGATSLPRLIRMNPLDNNFSN